MKRSTVVVRLEIDCDNAVDAHDVVEAFLDCGIVQDGLNHHEVDEGRLHVVSATAVNPEADDELVERALELAAGLPHYAVAGLLGRIAADLRDRSRREGFNSRALESALDLAETSARAADNVLAATSTDCG